LQRDGIQDLKYIDQSPDARQVYNQLLAIDQLIDDLGYQELHSDRYEQLMQQQEVKRRQSNSTDTKTKRELFISFK
jgi:hypothetical protein